ncbi:hypothetical protein Tco_0590498 [Tanacetum coccineum]
MESSSGITHLKIGAKSYVSANALLPSNIRKPMAREESRQQSKKQKAKLRWKKYYNARVRNKSFRPRDLVYRNNEARHVEDGGKLGPKWEGPYEVTEALGKGAYKLRDRNGKVLPRTWNVCNLKKCYVHEM